MLIYTYEREREGGMRMIQSRTFKRHCADTKDCNLERVLHCNLLHPEIALWSTSAWNQYRLGKDTKQNISKAFCKIITLKVSHNPNILKRFELSITSEFLSVLTSSWSPMYIICFFLARGDRISSSNLTKSVGRLLLKEAHERRKSWMCIKSKVDQ